MSVVLGVGAALAAFIGLVGAPVLLVWPRPLGRLVPRAGRRWLVGRPLRGALVIALPVVVAVSAVWSMIVLGSGESDRTLGHVLVVVLLSSAIFGGLTCFSLLRAIRTWIIGWTLADSSLMTLPAVVTTSPPSARSSTSTSRGQKRFAAPQPEARPAHPRQDRRWRNASSWLLSVGLAWYLLGRALQLGGHQASAPGWWWAVTLLLLASGLTVWVTRRVRWCRRQAKTEQGAATES